MKALANSIKFRDLDVEKRKKKPKKLTTQVQPMKSVQPSRGSTPRISCRIGLKMGSTNDLQYLKKKKEKIRSNPSSLEKENIDFYKVILRKSNKAFPKNSFLPLRQPVDGNLRSNYLFVYQIGFGGFGKVWKVQQKSTWKCFAMKQIQKQKVIEKDSVECILNERRILSQIQHPFLVNMNQAFQDQQNLYLVIDYLKGADLRYHICYKQKFTESETKFIIACIIQAVSYIHKHGIIHRDIKPENLIFQENGYLRITDFGIAKYENQIVMNVYDSSGTPGYMAPEILFREEYTYTSDFFAIGVIAYEMMLNKRPYQGKNRKQIKSKITEQQIKIEKYQIPDKWSENAADFINLLIEKKPHKRLGHQNGINELKTHPWLSDINWKKLAKKQISPCFIPQVVCETKQYLDQISCYNEMNKAEEKNYENISLNKQSQKLFEDYHFKRAKIPKNPKEKIIKTIIKKRNEKSSIRQSKMDN